MGKAAKTAANWGIFIRRNGEFWAAVDTTTDLHDTLRYAASVADGTSAADNLVIGPMWVEHMLSMLPPGDAELVRLRISEDLSFDAIAQYLSDKTGAETKAATVRVRYHRALQKLKVIADQDESRIFGSAKAVPLASRAPGTPNSMTSATGAAR